MVKCFSVSSGFGRALESMLSAGPPLFVSPLANISGIILLFRRLTSLALLWGSLCNLKIFFTVIIYIYTIVEDVLDYLLYHSCIV